MGLPLSPRNIFTSKPDFTLFVSLHPTCFWLVFYSPVEHRRSEMQHDLRLSKTHVDLLKKETPVEISPASFTSKAKG
jgi:hypothetical protein